MVEEIRKKVSTCETCSSALNETFEEKKCDVKKGMEDELLQKISDLHNELIQTKVALAEANSKNDVSYYLIYLNYIIELNYIINLNYVFCVGNHRRTS